MRETLQNVLEVLALVWVACTQRAFFAAVALLVCAPVIAVRMARARHGQDDTGAAKMQHFQYTIF